MSHSADEAAIKELFLKRDAAWNAHDAAAWSQSTPHVGLYPRTVGQVGQNEAAVHDVVG